jgi:hypothetical protein
MNHILSQHSDFRCKYRRFVLTFFIGKIPSWPSEKSVVPCRPSNFFNFPSGQCVQFYFLIGHCSVKVGEEKSLLPLMAFLWPTYLISSGIQLIYNLQIWLA